MGWTTMIFGSFVRFSLFWFRSIALVFDSIVRLNLSSSLIVFSEIGMLFYSSSKTVEEFVDMGVPILLIVKMMPFITCSHLGAPQSRPVVHQPAGDLSPIGHCASVH